jgi:hypothetical protein
LAGQVLAPLRHARLSWQCPFTGAERKSPWSGQRDANDPFETLVFRPRPHRSGGIQSIIRRYARALGDTLYQHSIARQMLAEPGQHVGVKLVTTEVVHRLVADAVVEDVRHVSHAVLPIAVD